MRRHRMLLHRRLRALFQAAVLPLIAVPSCSRPAPAPVAAEPEAGVETTAVRPPADPYHPPPRDTVSSAVYKGWQQLMLQCARCHGDDALGTSFAPNLVTALRPDGTVPTREDFLRILVDGRDDKGMPSAAKMGVDSVYFEGLYQYLKGRSDGQYHGGRPARRDE